MPPDHDPGRRALLKGLVAGTALSLTSTRAEAETAARTTEATFQEQAARLGIRGAAASLCGPQDRIFTAGEASIPFAVPVSPGTLFHIGSNGKHITAVAILRLVDEGRLRLDMPIGDILDDPLPPAWKSRRVASLLSHTSGLPDYGGFDWDRDYDRTAFLKLFGKADPDFDEGTAWAYSNTGYVLLGWIVERLHGRPYRAVVDALFRALALPAARVDDAGATVPLRAEPYDVRGPQPRHAVRMAGEMSGWPDGGVLFSARDFPGWSRALDSTLLSPALRQRMFAPTRLETGRSVPYGLGLFVDPLRGRPRQWHGGGVPGFTSWMVRDEHVALMLMTNVTLSSSAIIRHLGNLLLESVKPGSTPLSLPVLRDKHAALTRSTLTKLTTADGARFRLSGTPQRFDLVEEYEQPGQLMRRYRATWTDYVEHLLVGHDARERIFWAFGN